MRDTSTMPEVTAAGAPLGHLGQSLVPGGDLLPTALVLALGLGGGLLMIRSGRMRRRSVSAGYFCLVLAVAVLVSLAPARGPEPVAAPTTGTPVQAVFQAGGEAVTVTVVPNRPGTNLVSVATPKASAGTDRDHLVAGERRPGSTRTWVTVELAPGRSSLWVEAGGVVGEVKLDTGRGEAESRTGLAGPDGPECASAVVGAAAASAGQLPATCPADRLSGQDASALGSTVRHLRERGEKTLALAEDTSPRGAQAGTVVRSEAAKAGLRVVGPEEGRHPLVIVSGWSGADTTIRRVTEGTIAARGTYLAPWLLTAPALKPAAGQLIALRYSPRDPMPMRYVTALAGRYPGEQPTAAGYEEWQRALGGVRQAPAQLYAAAVAYLPGSGAGGTGHHGAAGTNWLPDGMITPVTGPLA
ncbi:hypothetical protein [Streptomyces sp. NPDC005494]|uniref:hypothetical protein n=1 Tax=Streptomyces sp. NPDC005494 TaxID=3364715 RepID=UPI0036978370